MKKVLPGKTDVEEKGKFMEADCSIFLCRTPHALGPEWVWGRKLCAEFLSEGNRNIPLRIVEHAPPFSVRDVLVSESALIGVVLDDGLLWGPLGWETLRQKLVQIPSLAVIGPVSNEATVREQQCAPPFPYQTPSALRLACLAQCQLYHNQWQETFALDPFAFLVRRSSLLTLDPELSLTQVPSSLALQGGVLGVALDTYVHRYRLCTSYHALICKSEFRETLPAFSTLAVRPEHLAPRLKLVKIAWSWG
ncbi:MAG: hypothetical protein AB7P69_28325 [Candidatus Binatia bacterium]